MRAPLATRIARQIRKMAATQCGCACAGEVGGCVSSKRLFLVFLCVRRSLSWRRALSLAPESKYPYMQKVHKVLRRVYVEYRE